MVCILLIISAVVAGSQSFIGSVGPVAIAAVVMHNAIGLLGGYWGGKLFGFDESTCRTLALEVGMQNSGLAATLGKLYFAAGGAARRTVFRLAQPFRLAAGGLLVRQTGQTSVRPCASRAGWHALPHRVRRQAVPARCTPPRKTAS